jgi:hypothetical protein
MNRKLKGISESEREMKHRKDGEHYIMIGFVILLDIRYYYGEQMKMCDI